MYVCQAGNAKRIIQRCFIFSHMPKNQSLPQTKCKLQRYSNTQEKLHCLQSSIFNSGQRKNKHLSSAIMPMLSLRAQIRVTQCLSVRCPFRPVQYGCRRCRRCSVRSVPCRVMSHHPAYGPEMGTGPGPLQVHRWQPFWSGTRLQPGRRGHCSGGGQAGPAPPPHGPHRSQPPSTAGGTTHPPGQLMGGHWGGGGGGGGLGSAPHAQLRQPAPLTSRSQNDGHR